MHKIVADVASALAGPGDGATVMIDGFGGRGQPAGLIDRLIAHGARELVIIDDDAGHGEVGLAARPKARRVRRIICSFPRQADSQGFDAP